MSETHTHEHTHTHSQIVLTKNDSGVIKYVAAAFAVGTRMAFADDIRHSYKRYSAGIAIWAFLVGISRVFVGKHFLGDVLVGFVTGILIAVLVLKLSRVVVRWLSL